MGSNSIWLVSIWKEEIWTHEGRPGMCLHRGKRLWGHSKKAVTCKARREASKEAHLLIPDFELPNCRIERKGTPVVKATWSVVFCHGSPSKPLQLHSLKCQLCRGRKTLIYDIQKQSWEKHLWEWKKSWIISTIKMANRRKEGKYICFPIKIF